MKVWLTLAACLLVFAAANWQGITDAEAAQTVAADAAQAPIDAAALVAFGRHPGLYLGSEP